MKHNVALIVASLLSLLLMIVHLTQDTIRQAEGSMTYPVPVVFLALWLYATLMAADRVWGYVIMLLGGLFSVAMIVVHARGIVATQAGGFFFVWTLFALSTTGWLRSSWRPVASDWPFARVARHHGDEPDGHEPRRRLANRASKKVKGLTRAERRQ